ncbi:MAG: ribonuclease P protein component 1 [Nanoarchaeota archaeon]|nr:ribonuclease P protein component 1 [Nanoarchaeota archaeon]
MITPKNLIKHELIGLEAEVVKSKNKSLIGLKGKIVDETKNMLTIETKKGEKKIIKKECTLRIKLNKEIVEVDGALLVGRPEKRIKKTIPKKRV